MNIRCSFEMGQIYKYLRQEVKKVVRVSSGLKIKWIALAKLTSDNTEILKKI